MNNFNHHQYRQCPPVLDTSDIQQMSEDAVRARLGPEYVSNYGIHGCVRHVQALADGVALIHLNSGGNACAVQSALVQLGYDVSPGPRPDCGMSLVVTHGRVSRINRGTVMSSSGLVAAHQLGRTGRTLDETMHAWRAYTRYWDEPLTSSNWDNYRPAMSTSPRRADSPGEWFLLFHRRWLPAGLAVTLATHGITAEEASSVYPEVMETPGGARARKDICTGNGSRAAALLVVTSWRWHLARGAQGLAQADRLNLQAIDKNWVTNLSGPSSGWTPGQPVTGEVRDAWAMLTALKRTDANETSPAFTTDTCPGDGSPAAVSESHDR